MAAGRSLIFPHRWGIIRRNVLSYLVRFSVILICLAAIGLNAQDVSPKVVGGKDATAGEYPWMVGLMDAYEPSNYYAQFCGGVLIHPYYVLTAAHCVEGETTVSLEILVGTDSLAFGGRRIDVSRIFTHPSYNPVTLDYDLALVRLATPVTDIEPVGLADEEVWQAVGTAARIIGWGQYRVSGGYPDDLQEGDVAIDPFAPANAAWSGTLTDRMIPATSPGGATDTCVGDSGGPLLVRRPTDGAWIVAGITSFGAQCGEDYPPAIYTRVHELVPYIYKTIYPDMAPYLDAYQQYALRSDYDEDSMPLFAEFAFSSNPKSGDLDALPEAGSLFYFGHTYSTLTFHRSRNMRSFKFSVEQAPTPTGPWQKYELSPLITRQGNLSSATEIITVRAAAPIGFAPYLRLKLEPTGSL